MLASCQQRVISRSVRVYGRRPPLDVERFFNFSGEPAETPLTKLPHWNAWQVVEEFDESEVPGWPKTKKECFELTERGQMVPSRAGLVANMKWVEGGDVDSCFGAKSLALHVSAGSSLSCSYGQWCCSRCPCGQSLEPDSH